MQEDGPLGRFSLWLPPFGRRRGYNRTRRGVILKVFASPERKRLQRTCGSRQAGPCPNLPGRQSFSPIREILHGPRGKHVVQNLDTEEPTRRRVHERLPEGTGGREKKAPPKGGKAAPACRYKKISFSYYDEAWQAFPAASGGGKELGPFVS